MLFLAQLNFAELPALPGFPESGLLQFFIGADDVSGVDFDDPSKTIRRVIWRPEVGSGQPAAELDASLPDLEAAHGEIYPPYELGSSFGITGTLGEQIVPVGTSVFDEILEGVEIANDDWDTYEKLDGPSPYHQFGGWRCFTQNDILPADSTMITLFQLDSDSTPSQDAIMWGDSGVANFFISEEDLAARDFSNVIFTWDCC